MGMGRKIRLTRAKDAGTEDGKDQAKERERDWEEDGDGKEDQATKREEKEHGDGKKDQAKEGGRWRWEGD